MGGGAGWGRASGVTNLTVKKCPLLKNWMLPYISRLVSEMDTTVYITYIL